MKRKQELMLIIRQLNKDLCEFASYINKEYSVLNENNLSSFKKDFARYDEIHLNLKLSIEEYNKLS